MENAKELLDKINEDIKKRLSTHRYTHSLGVMKKAEELAIKYGVDIDKSKLTGLSHDIAKEMSKEEMLEYADKNNIYIDEIEKNNIGLLHSKIGADICKKEYGFSTDMQNAILYHTTANENMDDLAKVIYIADKTEDGRNFEDLEIAKQIANIGLNEAIIYIIDVAIKNNIDKNRLIHPDSIIARNRFLLEK